MLHRSGPTLIKCRCFAMVFHLRGKKKNKVHGYLSPAMTTCIDETGRGGGGEGVLIMDGTVLYKETLKFLENVQTFIS